MLKLGGSVCVPLTSLYIQMFALKYYEGYQPDYAVPQRCSNFLQLI